MFAGALTAWVGVANAQTANSLLQLEAKIALGEVTGRIDHLAIDLSRQRLFVAELGNDSVAVLDLKAGKVKHVITGLKAPQGIGYVPSSDMVFVANADDGSGAAVPGRGLRAGGTTRSGR
jgi:DNA-binding beta-propeller fold protein YncE